MRLRAILPYALWFSGSETHVLNGLEDFSKSIVERFQIVPEKRDVQTSDLYVPIGPNFYLLTAEMHSSPGDISGYLRGNYLKGNGQVMAVLIDKADRRSIPTVAIDESCRKKLSRWVGGVEFSNVNYFVERELASTRKDALRVYLEEKLSVKDLDDKDAMVEKLNSLINEQDTHVNNIVEAIFELFPVHKAWFSKRLRG